MKQTIIKFEERFNIFSLLAEWLVLMIFNSESFQINFALSTISENRFFPPTKSFKILADEVSFCMHQKFYQTSVEPCQNSKVKCHL